MDRFCKAMDQIELSSEADKRIRARILLDASRKKGAYLEMSHKKVRKFSLGTAAAIAACAATVTVFAAGIVRINMNVKEEGNYAEVSYEAADTSYISLGNWLPSSLPEGYEETYVSGSFYSHRLKEYQNSAGKYIRFEYGLPDSFFVVADGFTDRKNVSVGEHEGILYAGPDNDRGIVWADQEAGVGFLLDTNDPAADVEKLAQSVTRTEKATALTDLFIEQDSAWYLEAVAELGDYTVNGALADYTAKTQTGSPTSKGSGWFAYVTKEYVNKEENKALRLTYETYRLPKGEEYTAVNVLAFISQSAEDAAANTTVNGSPAILSADGTRITWVSADKGLIFHLSSRSTTGEELRVLAETVQ